MLRVVLMWTRDNKAGRLPSDIEMMTPWGLLLGFVILHIRCVLSWKNTKLQPIQSCRLHVVAPQKPPVEAEPKQEKTRKIWENLFGKLKKAITTPEVKDVAATAKEEIDRVAGKELDYVMERGKKDINETIELSFSFSPTLQQILRDMKKKAEGDIKIVGDFFRGENGGAGADDAVRVVYRGEQEKEESEKEG